LASKDRTPRRSSNPCAVMRYFCTCRMLVSTCYAHTCGGMTAACRGASGVIAHGVRSTGGGSGLHQRRTLTACGAIGSANLVFL
jgi:hypothetical protein